MLSFNAVAAGRALLHNPNCLFRGILGFLNKSTCYLLHDGATMQTMPRYRKLLLSGGWSPS